MNEILQFDLGQDMKVFTVMIQQDQRCEEASEDFFAHLFLYENLAPVLRSTAQVIIRDTDCGMNEFWTLSTYFLSYSLNVGMKICTKCGWKPHLEKINPI